MRGGKTWGRQLKGDVKSLRVRKRSTQDLGKKVANAASSPLGNLMSKENRYSLSQEGKKCLAKLTWQGHNALDQYILKGKKCSEFGENTP